MNRLFFIFISVIASCHPKINSEIEGHWTTVHVVDNTDMNITDAVIYNKDGSCKFIVYSNGDSIVSETKGTFQFDPSNRMIEISSEGMKFQHEVLELDKQTMKIKTQQGIELFMKKIPHE